MGARSKSSRLGSLRREFGAVTGAYWDWLSAYCPLDLEGQRRKSKKMQNPLGLLRGSFYFWPRILETAAPTLADAPKILGVGDMHIENFGAWRDSEGRLVWGVNDFDDAARLPFVSDVVRLAASAILGAPKKAGLGARAAAKAVVAAYGAHLSQQPEPFVLEDRHPLLRDLAAADGTAAKEFWTAFESERGIDADKVDARAGELLLRALPVGAKVKAWYAPLSGTGSLGRPRFAVLAEFRGGYVAREIKAAAPSSLHLDRRDIEAPTAEYRALEAAAIRARDPFLQITPRWVVRRLSPESRKIEIGALKRASHWRDLLNAMGAELANVHIGSAATIAPLVQWTADKGEKRMIDASLACADIVADLAARGAVKRAK